MPQSFQSGYELTSCLEGYEASFRDHNCKIGTHEEQVNMKNAYLSIRLKISHIGMQVIQV